MSSERKVLAQDRSQYEQGNTALEKKRKGEELQYQKDLAEYNKFVGIQKQEEEKQKATAEKEKQKAAEIERKVNAYREEWWRKHPGFKGSVGNRAVAEYRFKLEGGSQAEWNKIIAKEDRDRKTSQAQSAGLRASGNRQIQQGIQEESKRLGGFTLVSPNIPQSKTTSVATGTVAQKAQGFGIGFTEETKQFGFVASKDTVSEPKTILTESEQRAKAQAAFAKPPTPPVGVVANVTNEIIYSRTGTGTLADPYKGKQPDKSLVPNFMKKYDQSYVGYSPTGEAIQGPTRPEISYEISIGSQAEKKESVYLPAGTLQYLVESNQLRPDPKKQLIVNPNFSTVPQGPSKPRPIESAFQFLSDTGKKYKDNPLIAYPVGAVEEGLGIVGGTINLIEQGKQKLNEFAPQKPLIKEVKKPYALPSSPFEYPTGIAIGTVFDKMPVSQAEKEARQRQIQILKEEGGSRYIGKLAVTVFTTVPFGVGLVRAGARIVKGIAKPVRNEAKIFLTKRADKMIDARKPFSYEIPYSPTRRANEIPIDSYVERVGPSTPLARKPIAARQSDVIIKSGKIANPVKSDPLYKPATRANEINVGGILPKENIVGKIELSKGFIPGKPETPLRGKVVEPVKPDAFYNPAKRANEIDISKDDVLFGFTSTRVRLGRSTIKTPEQIKQQKVVEEDPYYKPLGRYEGKPEDLLKSDTALPDELKIFKSTKVELGRGTAYRELNVEGKQTKPVDLDAFYKPTKRANEIDLDDFADKIKMPKVEGLKSERELDLKRELKRLKRKQPEFKRDNLPLGGTGFELKGKGQVLLTIKKQEQLTKKKLETKRTTPVNINWSEKVETASLPSTGASPLALIPLVRETKKKKPLQETQQTEQVQYEEIAQRPQQITRTSQPQRIIPRQGIKTIQVLRINQPQQTRQSPRYNVSFRTANRLRPKQEEKQKFKTPAPEFPKVKQFVTPKLRQPTRQTFKFSEDPRPPRRALLGPIYPDKPKKRTPIKTEPGKKADFLGNVSEISIGGVFKRTENIYGQKRINRLLKGDLRVVSGKTRTVRRTKQKTDLFGFKKKKTKIF